MPLRATSRVRLKTRAASGPQLRIRVGGLWHGVLQLFKALDRLGCALLPLDSLSLVLREHALPLEHGTLVPQSCVGTRLHLQVHLAKVDGTLLRPLRSLLESLLQVYLLHLQIVEAFLIH